MPIRGIRHITAVGVDSYHHNLVYTRVDIGVVHRIGRGSRVRTPVSKIPYIGLAVPDGILQPGVHRYATRRIIEPAVDRRPQPRAHPRKTERDLDRRQIAAIDARPIIGRPYSRRRW